LQKRSILWPPPFSGGQEGDSQGGREGDMRGELEVPLPKGDARGIVDVPHQTEKRYTGLTKIN
ncbi:MAG: hypothetical protein QNJ68_15430, partial [Microcoleaceae cyanobacterium MO_207.B10]|nr:hypothetical protein [Microcoleaceae cyanobacterium MO_207.B10]